MAKIEYSFWFLCLTSPYNFEPRVSCGHVVLQYDIYIIICFALTGNSFVVGTFFTGKMVKMRNDTINCILENLFKLNGSPCPFFIIIYYPASRQVAKIT